MVKIENLKIITKTTFYSFLLILSSPLVVKFYEQSFTTSGWLGIGNYDFNISDGIFRSFYCFIILYPTILLISLSRPKKFIKKTMKSRQSKLLYISILIIFMILYLVAYQFRLGMTGIETDTGGLRLSGLMHYLRNYLAPFFVFMYLISAKRPSFYFILLYSTIAGLTSLSRFAVTLPVILIGLVAYIKGERIPYFKILISMVFGFCLVTITRTYAFGGEFDTFGVIYRFFSEGDVIYLLSSSIEQIFLRLGIGRDIILSYEVMQTSKCNNILGLFWGSTPCQNAAYDFYGVIIPEGSPYYIGHPSILGLVIINGPFMFKFLLSILYGLTIFFAVKIISKISNKNNNAQTGIICLYWLLGSVFLILGPMRFFWVLTVLVYSSIFLYKLILRLNK